MSLQNMAKIDDDGVTFKSHLDGSLLRLTPKDSINMQNALDSTITMAFDECTPYPVSHDTALKSMNLSMKWAKLCRDNFIDRNGYGLFGIVQGSTFNDLREKSSESLINIGFDGYAIGGLAVGEGHDLMISTLKSSINYLPKEKPRYLMGVGYPKDIIEAVRLGVDPKQANQMVRGVASLPHGTGKPVRVAVFAQADAAKSAMDAGADVVGDDDLIDRVEKGFTDFDVAIATPEMMGKIGKLGRVLGRRGLMPNPRTNTVVQQQDVGSAVSEAKKGRVELRMDRTAIIHSSIGKASFQGEHLIDNLAAVIDTINQLKPTGIKGQFVKTAYLTTPMGPGIPLDVNSTMSLTAG